MNSKNCLLLSHIWILENQPYKKDIIDFCINHFITNNPDLYIILTGHGELPHDKTIDLCDFVDWKVEIDQSEIGRGHPKLVTSGLIHAKKIGFTKVLKQRADCIITTNNVHNYYDSLLEDKKFLVTTHPTTPTVIGDLLMYGDIDVFLNGWDISKWDPSVDGMINFTNTLTKHNDLKYTSIEKMKWVYLDPQWNEIIQNKNQVMKNDIDFSGWLWGLSYSARAQSPTYK